MHLCFKLGLLGKGCPRASEGVSQERGESLRRGVPGKGGKCQKGCPRKGGKASARVSQEKGRKHQKEGSKERGKSITKGWPSRGEPQNGTSSIRTFLQNIPM